MVVVHAQKRATGTGAARAWAKTHNIHAFVHPREAGDAFDLFVANRGEKRSKRRGEKEEGREGRVHIFITDQREAEEEEEGGAMTGPGDLSALGGAILSSSSITSSVLEVNAFRGRFERWSDDESSNATSVRLTQRSKSCSELSQRAKKHRNVTSPN